ncbi:MAG: DNA-protecting protein DprA [Planctomycetes bacterium]|nr:DNA-protecting protein DprA [Planctomycetota bacterium]
MFPGLLFSGEATIANNHNHSQDIELWLKLIRSEGIGPVTFGRLLKRFSTVDRIFGASVSELTKIDGIGDRTAQRIVRTRDDFCPKTELALADKLGVYVINLDDDRYPPPLKSIPDAPPVLYVKGEFQRSDSLAVAIVGSRRCSAYGTEQASRFAHLLASAGFTIVSGMARGIDTAGHRGAISACGRTIAVQGCGLSNIFPPENEELFAKIAGCGACISELPLGYEPLSENFPARNRIIAALSMGVVVIEATAKSGALLTVKASLAYNREVMAVPGKIDSYLSAGAHKIIKQGAKLVDCIEDVMEALGYIGQGIKAHASQAAEKAEKESDMPLFDVGRLNLSDNERAVIALLDGDPLHTDEVIGKTQLGAGAVNSALISLRLKGLIKQLPGNLFKKL